MRPGRKKEPIALHFKLLGFKLERAAMVNQYFLMNPMDLFSPYFHLKVVNFDPKCSSTYLIDRIVKGGRSLEKTM